MDAAANTTKRSWIYAKMPAGIWYKRRQWVGYGLLALFILIPFIKIGQYPLLMLNVVSRKFAVFGMLFYPQDLYLFVFGMLIAMIGIVFITAKFGRVWCGWACPQTVFMELIFRRIEYWIEGDWTQQRKLNEGPDTDERAWKKFFKHSIFLLISFLISNLFLAYVIGVDELWQIISEPIAAHTVGFVSLLVFTAVFYSVFAHLREIVCITICPYGRLQSVLVDDSTKTVAYDYQRGEPRGKVRKVATEAKGDCLDCKLCVHVCPTGIDIRNGLQLECVNCTACIDACDAVMDKLQKPIGLIGFYSANELETGVRTEKKSNRRLWAYAAVLVVLTSVFAALMINRSPIDGRLLRAKGSSYQKREDNTVSNLYTLELTNKSGNAIPFTLRSEDEKMKVQVINHIDMLASDGTAMMSFFLISPKANIKTYKTDVKLQLVSNGEVVKTMKTTFVAPIANAVTKQ
ncbi:cytochrome c oxidase accessory protein CcoG [Sphingobacterium corticis]|uniref:Cytochrome c oxidase accessory protein CcoG n=1 Tax=Sphingobacterium corticis TaxID=1812823 RepID=A0ABW5NKY6_9SPHI